MLGFIFKDKVFTEEDWTEDATVNSSPYFYSKVEAERLAWKYHSDQIAKSDGWKFDLVTTLPAYVLGPILNPQHLNSTPQIALQLMDGSLPMIPDLTVGIVDVRDVALVHILAIENENARGRYILVNNEHLNLKKIADIIRTAFPKYRVPIMGMPNWLVCFISLFHPLMSFHHLKQNLGNVHQYYAKKIESELGMTWIDSQTSISQTVDSFFEFEVLEKR